VPGIATPAAVVAISIAAASGAYGTRPPKTASQPIAMSAAASIGPSGHPPARPLASFGMMKYAAQIARAARRRRCSADTLAVSSL